MHNFILTEAQLNEVLKYIGSRPYAEVFKLVSMLGNLPVHSESAPPADVPAEVPPNG